MHYMRSMRLKVSLPSRWLYPGYRYSEIHMPSVLMSCRLMINYRGHTLTTAIQPYIYDQCVTANDLLVPDGISSSVD